MKIGKYVIPIFVGAKGIKEYSDNLTIKMKERRHIIIDLTKMYDI